MKTNNIPIPSYIDKITPLEAYLQGFNDGYERRKNECEEQSEPVKFIFAHTKLK